MGCGGSSPLDRTKLLETLSLWKKSTGFFGAFSANWEHKTRPTYVKGIYAILRPGLVSQTNTSSATYSSYLFGGDPILPAKELLTLVREIKKLGKAVWLYTGFTLKVLVTRNAAANIHG
ncbi:4Fe-4S cluster-binding domain-containing protein [Phosphitispora fastidiosa]|uniref:4Fe-4S cluster-binding domain-containing protein n=1 Tax=Phosphitispora fastidiosa TaxID=2837202 RepID=UPI00339070C4